MENAMIAAQERHNNRSFNFRRPLHDPCECGQREAIGSLIGKARTQRLCWYCIKEGFNLEIDDA